ncbi:hypothetical protein [Solibacillus sp. FSL W8-0372]|uniref:hypothetical protein n=1 Tax=Solibacillus sp. FSL W8-0372 TaxID=2921713 RepID=UPI0030CA6589
MNKLDEIKAFVQKNKKVIAELAQVAEHSKLYSHSLSDEIIELQQELRRCARRIGIISVGKPFFEDSEYVVLLDFDNFCSFIDLDDCMMKPFIKEGDTFYIYSITIGNLYLKAIKSPNEEHKKAQAI